MKPNDGLKSFTLRHGVRFYLEQLIKKTVLTAQKEMQFQIKPFRVKAALR